MDPSFNQPQPGVPGNPGVFPGAGSMPAPQATNTGMAGQAYAMPGAVPATAPPPNTYNPAAANGAAVPGQPGAAPQLAPKSNPNSTQNALQIAEIRDGIVIMNDGSFRSVIMAKSINFDLMSPQEREAVEYSYQGFLNSLYFPIQILVRSQKVDLEPYIEKLDKIRTEHDNMLLALLMEDYINYMDQLSRQTNIMDKKFYVVVPYFPTVDLQGTIASSKGFLSNLGSMFSNKQQQVVTIDEAALAKAKDELRNRVQAILGGLMQCGIQGLPLDTQELIELYYDSYNPDTATRQELKNFNDLSVPVVTKGAGMAPQPALDRETIA
ncbi:hypothetical protein EKI60_01950 [Candidatus Saccharibacteria bacterium]|nr:MAG: hypothetical protein EKI60_01950 [Candidatus Saccharibacteria bacterium]